MDLSAAYSAPTRCRQPGELVYSGPASTPARAAGGHAAGSAVPHVPAPDPAAPAPVPAPRTRVVAKHGSRWDGRVESGHLQAGVAGGRAVPAHNELWTQRVAEHNGLRAGSGLSLQVAAPGSGGQPCCASKASGRCAARRCAGIWCKEQGSLACSQCTAGMSTSQPATQHPSNP